MVLRMLIASITSESHHSFDTPVAAEVHEAGASSGRTRPRNAETLCRVPYITDYATEYEGSLSLAMSLPTMIVGFVRYSRLPL